MKYIFYSCDNLETLYIPYFNTLECSEKNLAGIFEGCYNLTININVNKCKNLIKILPNYINYTSVESFKN